MKKLAVIVDTWTNEYQDLKNGYDIFVTPLMILINKDGKVEEYRDYLDIDRETTLKEVNSDNSKISTSQPLIGQSMMKLENILKNYEQVLIAPIPKVLSGTYASWESIISELDLEDQKRVHLEDLCDFGNANYDAIVEGFDEFKNDEQIFSNMLRKLRERKEKFFIAMHVEKLDALIKSGRLGALKGAFAKFLKQKVSLEWKDGFKKLVVGSDIKKHVFKSLETANKKLSFIKKGIKKIYIPYVYGADKKLFNLYFQHIKEYLKVNKVKVNKMITCDVANIVVSHLGSDIVGICIEVE